MGVCNIGNRQSEVTSRRRDIFKRVMSKTSRHQSTDDLERHQNVAADDSKSLVN